MISLYEKESIYREIKLTYNEVVSIRDILYFEIESLNAHGDNDSQKQKEDLEKIYFKLEKVI